MTLTPYTPQGILHAHHIYKTHCDGIQRHCGNDIDKMKSELWKRANGDDNGALQFQQAMKVVAICHVTDMLRIERAA